MVFIPETVTADGPRHAAALAFRRPAAQHGERRQPAFGRRGAPQVGAPARRWDFPRAAGLRGRALDVG
eukprot:5185316-Pyramimonas_sp.AAC.1